jgi:hypothetical protein
MAKPFDLFDAKKQYLIQNGWIERTPMSFVKYGFELFFDNSTAVELYPSNENNRRIGDFQICTIADLANLEDDIKNGKFKP